MRVLYALEHGLDIHKPPLFGSSSLRSEMDTNKSKLNGIEGRRNILNNLLSSQIQDANGDLVPEDDRTDLQNALMMIHDSTDAKEAIYQRSHALRMAGTQKAHPAHRIVDT